MTDSRHRPLPADDQALVRDWIRHADATRFATDVTRFARYVPELGWRAIVAILQLRAATSYLDDIAELIFFIVTKFSEAFIGRIEVEAMVSPIFRRCLRRVRPDPKFRVLESLWPRLAAAAGRNLGPVSEFDEELYAKSPGQLDRIHYDPDPLPPDDAPVLTDEQIHEYANAWIVYRDTRWAREALTVASLQDPWDAVWPIVIGIVNHGSDHAVASIGESVLASMIFRGDPDLIDRIEAVAPRSARLRYCLSFVEPVKDVPPPLWERLLKARGDEPQRRLYPDEANGG